ncbi:hypothetical protein GMOD_00002221 [Pyrenophora seminiperda CCB06]|uniref:Uncharacterized protein n=1 Tax=Pyrenophora seminiperda CCB06 TaxID=1302712 RepID=A0A3M7LX86_9PLEO|nr:hypothetical protein GMOD_00002221 [Pyrenophora seminiperda CCB06]
MSPKHHCPGQSSWVNGISPGNCVTTTIETTQGKKLSFCKKHSMLCHCGDSFHLRSQDGCQSCWAKIEAEERAKKLAEEAEKAAENKKAADDFWNPGKSRKKPATQLQK